MPIGRTLRTRIVLILAAVVFVATGLLFVVSDQVVTRGFGSLEERQARHRASLGAKQLENEEVRISELALGYAAWDDMYDYVAHPSATFIESAVPPDWLSRVRLNVMAVIDSKGEPIFAKSMLDSVISRNLPDGLLPQLRTGGPLVAHTSTASGRSGIVVLPSGMWLMATRPIVTSTGKGPIRGTFLLGRRLDDELLTRFSRAIALTIHLETAPAGGRWLEGGYQVRSDSRESMTALVPLRDMYGHRVSWLAIDVPREVEAERRHTQWYLAASLLLAAAVFVGVVVALLNHYIVRRVSRLASFLRDVDETRDFFSRIEDTSGDEIGQVAVAVNDLLRTIVQRNMEVERARAQAVDALTESAKQNHALEAANKLIAQMARTDGLTGLPNRRTLDERIDQQIARSLRHGEPFALLLADMDHFKEINDQAGHLVGDRVLVHAASVFAANTRAFDTAARYGGEEFAVLLPRSTPNDARIVAERIRHSVEALVVPGHDGRVTISIGVAQWIPGESREALIARADSLLYEAKGAGRNQVRSDTSDVVNGSPSRATVTDLAPARDGSGPAAQSWPL